MFTESTYLCRLMNLKEIQSQIKSRHSELNNIRDMSDNIIANKAKFKNDIANLKEILDCAEDVKRRYRDIFVQISDR